MKLNKVTSILKWFGCGNGVVSGMLQNFFKMTFLGRFFFLAQPVTFYTLLGSVHQTYQVVFLLFDGHLISIFDATKITQFLVLPIGLYMSMRVWVTWMK